MSVNGIIGGLPDFMADFDLKNLSRGKGIKELKEEISPASIAITSGLASQTIPTVNTEQLDWSSQKALNSSSGQSTVLNNNFFDLDTEVSKYIKAQMMTPSIDEVRNELGSMIYQMFVSVDMYGGATGQMRELKKSQTQLESTEDNLEEIKESIETQAEEATAPKDADGNPIQTLTGDGQPDATPATPVVKVPTVSAAEVASATASTAAASAPVSSTPLSTATTSVPTSASIDIIV